MQHHCPLKQSPDDFYTSLLTYKALGILLLRLKRQLVAIVVVSQHLLLSAQIERIETVHGLI